MGWPRAEQGRGDLSFLPALACAYADFVARMAALVHRHIYRTGATLLAESLTLPTLPAGYGELAGMVMAGTLADAGKIAVAIEATWAGLGPWLDAEEVDYSGATRRPWPAENEL